MKKHISDLTEEEKRVIEGGGTEAPFKGKYCDTFEEGIYLCRKCGTPLFKSEDKFPCTCGWPAFDDIIPGAVKRLPDSDGVRTEIQCSNCNAHLGHVFKGEKITPKDTRHCVNSISLDFKERSSLEKTVLGGGCFWGLQHLLKDLPGVIMTTCGYCGGTVEEPTYEDVCTGETGHIETVEVLFDPQEVSFEDVARFFFEIHNSTQVGRQGPDIGNQYQSAVFCQDESQREILKKLKEELKLKGINSATELMDDSPFWPAEEYHQNYYDRTGKAPYCHSHSVIF